jgi:hypothetical protein
MHQLKLKLVFLYIVGLPNENTKICIASTAPEECTFEGIKRTFMETANKVDTNGIFIFSFSGHGIKGQQETFGLAPSDFNRTTKTLITAGMLVDWLHSIRFQGRYALFILDSCFAGGLAKQIILDSIQSDIPTPGVFVLSACTAYQSSIVVTSLGHSTFNYFLSLCLFNSTDSQSGQLAIGDIYKECNACCIAFSSLLVSYDAKSKQLKWSAMQPVFKYFQLTAFIWSLFEESEDEIDAAETGRFQFVLDYYFRHKKHSVVIPDTCQAWLEDVSGPGGALQELHKRQLLEGRLLTATICSMICSMASIFIAHKTPHISDRNVFIVAFVHVLAAIDRVTKDLTVTKLDLKLGIEYYFHALQKHNIFAGELTLLHNVVKKSIKEEEEKLLGYSESTDSGEDDIPPVIEWTPVELEFQD